MGAEVRQRRWAAWPPNAKARAAVTAARAWPALLALCGMSVMLAPWTPVRAQGAAASAGHSGDQAHDPRAWLMRIHEAASRRNYQGTLIVTSGGASSSSRVLHFIDGEHQFERVDWLDGEARSQLRHDDVVHTVWPRAKVALVEQRDARAIFPALLSGGERRVLEWYELRPLGTDRVAGLEADVVMLKARDGLRFSQRLWADRRSGLLLRADVVAGSGQVLESVAFSELSIGVRPQPELVLATLRQLQGYRVIRSQMLPARLSAEGWQFVSLPAGFREVHCERRSLDPTAPQASPVVLQTIFSDGLTHVSLFIEPFDSKRHQVEASSVVGATSTITARRAEYWITAMGDVPPDTLKRLVSALERRR